MTADLRAIHHRTLELVSDFEIWVEAHIDLAEKWDGRWPGREPEADWKGRARRAEAEREAARTFAYSAPTGSTPRCSRWSASWRR